MHHSNEACTLLRITQFDYQKVVQVPRLFTHYNMLYNISMDAEMSTIQ